MWGNLTDRINRTQTKLISDPEELYRYLATPGIEVVHLVFANDEVVWVSWKFTAEERVPSQRHTNEVIGAYVTTGARIHSYGTSIDCKKRLFIVTQIPLYLSNREMNPDWLKLGTIWET